MNEQQEQKRYIVHQEYGNWYVLDTGRPKGFPREVVAVCSCSRAVYAERVAGAMNEADKGLVK
jgi:hypothetical protein